MRQPEQEALEGARWKLWGRWPDGPRGAEHELFRRISRHAWQRGECVVAYRADGKPFWRMMRKKKFGLRRKSRR